MKNTEPKWRVEYHCQNDTGPRDESFREWWNVTDGEMQFSCNSEMHADWLCIVLNKWSEPEDERPSAEFMKINSALIEEALKGQAVTKGRCANCDHWRKLNEEDRGMYPFADRLSDQLARRVEIGHCVASGIRTGPTADGDWCESWELAMPDAR